LQLSSESLTKATGGSKLVRNVYFI